MNEKSTFPGIWKYPTDRVTPFRTPFEWLQAKKKDDDIGSLWRVHDKLYDLTSFMVTHPGGSEWIEMTQGLDITEAFEAHHVLRYKKVAEILKKFYVKEAEFPRNSPYTFKEDGFYKTLKKAVEPVLMKVGTGPSRKILLMQDGLIVLFVILSLIGSWKGSMTLGILAGIVLTMAANGAHNFIHLRENWRKNYMDFSLQSSFDWRINHILSHHLYPNTVLDSEMSLLEPVFDFKVSKNKTWIQKYLPIVYGFPFIFLLLWIGYFSRWRNILNGVQPFRPQELIVIIQISLFSLMAANLTQGFLFWCVVQTSCSVYFGLFSFTVAHHHPSIWHDGDEARPDPDFGLCQLDAVRERSDVIYESLFIVMTRYGEHSLHHLFPSVCHSKLSVLKPVLFNTLTQFEEELLAYPEWELYFGTFRQLQKTEKSRFRKLTKENERCKAKEL